MVATAVELEADAAAEDTTDNDNCRYKCPYCGTLYQQPPKYRCDHLIYETEFVESNDEMVTIPDHPIVASLFGMEVPRVVAGRFMHFLRSRPSTTNGQSPSHPCVLTLDLLSATPLLTIKYSQEYPDCFREWTYYLTANPRSAMREFVSFVKKHYCSSSSSSGGGGGAGSGSNNPPVLVPFSRINVGPEVMTLSVDDLVPDRCRIGNWVMLTGLPDDLPLFFFATTTNQGNTAFLNHSTNTLSRMEQWNTSTASLPHNLTLYSLSRLPAVALN